MQNITEQTSTRQSLESFFCFDDWMGRKPKTEDQIIYEYSKKEDKLIFDIEYKYNIKIEKETRGIIEKIERQKDRELARKQKALHTKRDNELKNRWLKKGKVKTIKPLLSSKKKKLLKIIQRYVVLDETDADGRGQCIYCKKNVNSEFIHEDRQANWCHCYTSSKNATAFDRENIHLWCNWCNKADACGNMEARDNYRVNIDREYGDWMYEELKRRASQLLWLNELKKVYWMDIDQLIEHRSSKLKALEEKKNILLSKRKIK